PAGSPRRRQRPPAAHAGRKRSPLESHQRFRHPRRLLRIRLPDPPRQDPARRPRPPGPARAPHPRPLPLPPLPRRRRRPRPPHHPLAHRPPPPAPGRRRLLVPHHLRHPPHHHRNLAPPRLPVHQRPPRRPLPRPVAQRRHDRLRRLSSHRPHQTR